MRFRATIDLNGKTATGIRVPPDVVAALDSGKRPAVRVTIAGYTYRTTVAPRGDRFLISVSAENRERAGVSKKQRHVLAVEGAKTAETRQRRIAKAVDELRALPR